MGRTMRGIAPRGRTIQIGFMYRGVWCREALHLDPMKPANLKYAQNLRAEILRRIKDGTFSYADYFPKSARATHGTAVTSIDRYLERWLKRIRPMVKSSTYRDYAKSVRILSAAFGIDRPDQITRPRVQDWLVERGASTKRAANLISPLRMALQDALDESLIHANPLAGWRYRAPQKAQRSPVDPFTAEEQRAILDALDGQGRNLVQFALWTGLRTSELVALEWGDVDWQKGEIYVSRALTQASEEPEGTKTRSGTRWVKLLAPALQALKAQKAHTFLADRQVFLNPRTGTAWTGDQAIRKTLWQPALKRAGVRYRKPYQTRHTYASMMLSAGEPVGWVARQMGHSSAMLTMQTYARWIPESMPDVGGKAVEMFSENRKITAQDAAND